ncbi:MAG: hypothetical protein K6G25_10295 [Bacteroidales bacterium]|nr:hypothetical protein [Bacteroidales bacterium]
MKTIILKTKEEIEDFLLLRNQFDGHVFIATDYNSFITIKDVAGWEHRPFHVYHGADIKDGDLVVEGMIHIASQVNLPEKDNVIKSIEPFMDKFVYKIKVAEISGIELMKIQK